MLRLSLGMTRHDPAGGLADAARMAFTDALGIAVLVAAGVALAGAVLIARFMPARHLPVEEGTGSGNETAASDRTNVQAEAVQ